METPHSAPRAERSAPLGRQSLRGDVIQIQRHRKKKELERNQISKELHSDYLHNMVKNFSCSQYVPEVLLLVVTTRGFYYTTVPMYCGYF